MTFRIFAHQRCVATSGELEYLNKAYERQSYFLDTLLAREVVLCKIEPKPRLSHKPAEAIKV